MSGTAIDSQKAAWLIGPTAKICLKRARSRRRARNRRRHRGLCRADRRARSPRRRVARREDWRCAADRWSTPGMRRCGRPPGGPSFGRARTDRNARAVSFRVDLKDMAGQDSQLPALLQRSDLRFDLRRHTVAVNVPPGARVFEEPSAGFARHGAPDRLHMGAEAVNDASPISAALHFVARSRAKPMQKRSEPRRRRQFRFGEWRGLDAAMGLREKTAPGEGDNGSAMAGLLNAIAASTIVSPVPRIRIVNLGRSFHERGSSHGLTNGASSVSEASCPQHRTAISKTAVSEPEKRRVTEPSCSLRPVTFREANARAGRSQPDDLRSGRPGSGRRPRGEQSKSDPRPMPVRSQPTPEMIGIVGESAHVRRSHVQSMALVFGRISKPPADLLARFDQSE